MFIKLRRVFVLHSVLHSAVLVAAGLALLFLGVLYSSPAYVMALLVFSCWGALRLGKIQQWWLVFKACLFLWGLVMLFNLLISTDGDTELYALSGIPLWGSVRLTAESLFFGFAMGMKLTLLICLCQIYRFWVGADRSFSVLHRLTPQSSILLSLSVLMLPQLQRRFAQAYAALKARGALCAEHCLRGRIESYCLLLRVMLATALEDSWAKAEALYSRGYGVGPRSCYLVESWKPLDSLMTVLLSLVLAASIGRYVQGGGQLECYPSLVLSDSLFDSWVILLQLGFFGGLLMLTQPQQKGGGGDAVPA